MSIGRLNKASMSFLKGVDSEMGSGTGRGGKRTEEGGGEMDRGHNKPEYIYNISTYQFILFADIFHVS